MQGSIRKRCQCPPRRDRRARPIPCPKAHGSWGYVVDVPASLGVPRRQVTRGDSRTKKDAEQALAMFAAELARGHVPPRKAGERLYAAGLLALACGLRRGELAGLRWQDVDLDRATISIVHQRTVDAEWAVISKEPKGTSRRTIDLGEGTGEALRSHATQTQDERLAWGSVYDETGPVFVHEDDRAYHPDRFTRMFRCRHSRGSTRIRLHDARHSCATLALDAGIHPKVVQQLLGHASWSTTMDLYTHRVERLQKEASAHIEALVLDKAM